MVERDTDYERVLEAWREVPRIAHGRVIPNSREALLAFVEEPLKEAVGVLYDRNILTLGSSCNIHDFSQGFAWISVDVATLSPENLAVIDSYPHHKYTKIDNMDVEIVGLFFPIGEMDTPNDVGRRATLLAEQFVVQPLSWITTVKLEDVLSYFREGDGADLSTEEIIQNLTDDGFYFDIETQTFFPSEEQFQKYMSSQQTAS